MILDPLGKKYLFLHQITSASHPCYSGPRSTFSIHSMHMRGETTTRIGAPPLCLRLRLRHVPPRIRLWRTALHRRAPRLIPRDTRPAPTSRRASSSPLTTTRLPPRVLRLRMTLKENSCPRKGRTQIGY